MRTIHVARGNAGHDGLQDGLLALLRSGQLPAGNGTAATIVLTMTPEQIDNRSGLVTTGHGASIAVEQALTLFGDARVMAVVLTKTKEIAAYGDTHRIFTEGQRLAMIARDRGLDVSDDQRRTAPDTARLDRPRPNTTTQPSARPNRRLNAGRALRRDPDH